MRLTEIIETFRIIDQSKSLQMKKQLFFTLAFIFSSLYASTQSIRILELANLSVCSETAIIIEVDNNTNQSLENINIDISFTCAVTYVEGTIVGAEESDLTDLANPMFNLGAIEANGTYRLELTVELDCQLQSCIEAGVLPEIEVILFHDDGSISDKLSYTVETALVLITDVQSPIAFALAGDELTRTITIRNTRPGKVERFRFVDRHDRGLFISIEEGIVINSNSEIIEVEFGPDDFINIGNGDEFFDFNEELIIEENIIVDICDYTVRTIASELLTIWRCTGVSCPSVENSFFSIINVEESPNIGDILEVTTIDSLPECLCNEQGNIQGLRIVNTSDVSNAFDIVIRIEQSLPDVNIINNPVTVDRGGVISTQEIVVDELVVQTCNETIETYKIIQFEIGPIAPMEEITITWESLYCFQEPKDAIENRWFYRYNYKKDCAPPPDVNQSGRDFSNVGNELSIEGELLGDFFLSENERFEFLYVLQSDLISVIEGTLLVEYMIPCLLELEDTDWEFAGTTPVLVEEETEDGTTTISLYYNMPLDVNVDSIAFPVLLSCGVACAEMPTMQETNSSCPDDCILEGKELDIFAAAYILQDDTCTDSCAVQTCTSRKYNYECDFEAVIEDIPGYLNSTISSQRTTLGGVDNDDDNCLDVSGSLDLEKIRLDRVRVKDTFQISTSSEVVTELPDFEFENFALLLKIDRELIEGMSPSLLSQEFPQIVNPDNGLVHIGNKVRITDVSTGMVYNCTDLPIAYDKNIITRPYIVIDEEMKSNFCELPSGFNFQHGDIIDVDLDFRIDYNYRSRPNEFGILELYFEANASVHNLDVFDFNDLYSCGCPITILEYANIKHDILGSTASRINICDGDVEGGAFNKFLFFGIAPNFFPSEFRPSGDIKDIKIINLEGLDLVDTYVNYLRVDNTIIEDTIVVAPSLIENEIIEIEEAPDITEIYHYDLLTLVKNLEAEHVEISFSFDFRNEDCIFEGRASYEDAMTFDYCSIEFPETTDTVSTPYFFIGKKPNLGLVYTDFCDASTLDRTYVQFFEIINSENVIVADAPNMWIQFISATDLVADFVLKNSETQLAYPSINNIFQLETLGVGDTLRLELNGTINSCDREQVIFRYGWHCEAYDEPIDIPCFESSFTCTIESPEGVLETLIDSEPISTSLCTPYEFVELEIFNAGIGNIFDIEIEGQLPPGLQLISGTSEIAYPTENGSFVSIGDPTMINDLNYVWKTDSLSLLFQEGVVGVNDLPNNSFLLRFRVQPDCGFIVGTSIYFRTKGEKVCAEALNISSRKGPVLEVEGIEVSDDININATANSLNCKEEIDFSISYSVTNTSSPSLLYLTLPEGTLYQDESATGNLPEVIPMQNANQLIWEVPAAQNEVNIDFVLDNIIGLDCGFLEFLVFTSIEINENCAALDSTCAIQVLTGEEIIRFQIRKPIFDIVQAGLSFSESGTLGNYDLDLSILNSGIANSTNLELEIYHDLDGDGVLSPLDTLIDATSFFEFIPNNGNAKDIVVEDIALQLDQICDIIIILDKDKNCMCGEEVYKLSFTNIVIAQEVSVCPGMIIELGIEGEAGLSYEWDDANNISCIACSMTEYTGVNNSGLAILDTITLTQSDLEFCDIIFQYIITVHTQPSILTPDETICNGDTITMIASNGQLYNWTGPDLIDPSTQTQEITPDTDVSYMVYIEDANGCSARDSVIITVNQAPELTLGNDISTCVGATVMLSAPEDPELTYLWSPAIFLDDPTSSNPTIINNIDKVYTLEVSNGPCTAEDQIAVSFGDELSLENLEDIILCAGEEISLELDPLYSYTWIPEVGIICQNNDCSLVTLSGSENITYQIDVIDTQGCATSIELSVELSALVNNETESAEICQGESYTFYNEEYEATGIYCDTTINAEGCMVISCLDLNVISVNNSSITEQICEGEVIEINGEIISDSGEYCTEYMSVNGCDSLHCIVIDILPLPSIDGLPDTIEAEEGEVVTLEENNDYSIYDWSGTDNLSCYDCSNPDYTITQDEEIIVEVIDENGCVNSKVIEVILRTTCRLEDKLVPTAITPNGNGKNEVFRVMNVRRDEIIVHIEIYNRWGEKLYEDSTNAGWDGTYKSESVPEGIYLYIVEISCPTGVIQLLKGDLTVIR